ncbi:MAG: hypothetical protein M0R06_22325, partial [Sphaerochaeta sp.]|nr:hypothetical protein [Sphaerochaeta sp.]
MIESLSPQYQVSSGPSLLQTLAKALADQLEFDTGVRGQPWEQWLRTMYPALFTAPFAVHHAEFWRWVEAINSSSAPAPFFAIWPRGGAKTTSAEAAVTFLAARNTRRFCLYVRGTQDKANESISNIAAMFESRRFVAAYPQVAARKLSRYGYSRGWRVDQLRCASGFSVVGLGFDAAVRGVKIEEARPDLIILDDVDEMHDTAAVVDKKIETLTMSILPAGAPNVAILGVQNLIHKGSIFDQIANGTAEFFHNRVVSGPHPAVNALEYEHNPDGGYYITGGQATWEGQNITTCEKQINEWGLRAFLREAQHIVELPGGVWDNVEFRHCAPDEVPDLVRGAVWVDPAVTATDDSDCQAMQADALGVDGKLYRLASWEHIATPEQAVARAVLMCLDLELDAVGIETDQGGDTWRSVYAQVWERLIEAARAAERGDDAWFSTGNEHLVGVTRHAIGLLDGTTRRPAFRSAKAGAGHGSKVARNQRMLADYERGRVIHVQGRTGPLEDSLRRFPNKPLDLADAAYWGWNDLLGARRGEAGVATLRTATAAHVPHFTSLVQPE